MDHELLYEYNPWWEGDYPFDDIIRRRELELKFEELIPSRSVLFLTGLRRVGKTTLMKQAIGKLIAKGVSPKKILYVSMDDYLLRDKSILDVIDEYRKLHKISTDTFVYLFLDEIAAVPKFRQQLKNLYDKKQSKIVVSSSSTSAL